MAKKAAPSHGSGCTLGLELNFVEKCFCFDGLLVDVCWLFSSYPTNLDNATQKQ